MLLAPPVAEPPADHLHVHVTADPAASPHLAVTPDHAARLIRHGFAIAVVNEDAADPRQWLHIVASAAPADGDVSR